MADEFEYIKNRIDKIEGVLERIADVSTDIKSMLAVHEHKIIINEKNQQYIEEIIEKRRIELDDRINKVYNTIRQQDEKVLEHLENIKEESSAQHKSLSNKITAMEKTMWLYVGGVSVLAFLIAYGDDLLKIIKPH
jgi:hypothetical protein